MRRLSPRATRDCRGLNRVPTRLEGVLPLDERFSFPGWRDNRPAPVLGHGERGVRAGAEAAVREALQVSPAGEGEGVAGLDVVEHEVVAGAEAAAALGGDLHPGGAGDVADVGGGAAVRGGDTLAAEEARA